MEKTIIKHLSLYDFDIRKSKDARFMDQKCTPDVVCFIADCIINCTDPNKEFTVNDVWNSPYFNNNVMAIFNKPSALNNTTNSEYDKFIQQPLRMLAYAKVLDIRKEGNMNVYRINNFDILDFISRKDYSAFKFLYLYLCKVLTDSGLFRYFEEYKVKCLQRTVTPIDFNDLKDRFTRFIIGFTSIKTDVEVKRIFPKILNVYAVQNHINGSVRGIMSTYPFAFIDLMYNRKNWRDINKNKSISRQEAEAQLENTEQRERFTQYYINKAANILKRIQIESEVKDAYSYGEATQVHHIFPKSEFPEIADYIENMIKLTATQHYTLAHPKNNTKEINRYYQLTCLLAKSDTIKKSILNFGEKYYRKESFIYVIETGLNISNIPLNITYEDLNEELIRYYNNKLL